MLKPGKYAVVGAAESTEIGKVPHLSSVGLALDAAANALDDAELKPSDIDGLTTGYLPPGDIAMQLGVQPTWVDNTVVGGCSWMFHLRSAMAAIEAGYCSTVLIVYGESGRSHAAAPNVYDIGCKGSISQQFDVPYGGRNMQVALFGLPIVRYMHEYGASEAQFATVPVVQRQWAMKNPRAKLREPITADEVLASRMIAWPIRRAMCCLTSDAGGALIVAAAGRAKDFPKPPVYVLGTGAAVQTGLASPAGVEDPLRPAFVRVSGGNALKSAGVSLSEIDHLMIYDAFAHNPIMGLEGLGFVPYGEGAAYIAEGNTLPGGTLPVNTNGGGLSYAHSGSYGMLCMLESIRQLRGEASAQVDGARISMAHGWGGFWSACATVVFSNQL